MSRIDELIADHCPEGVAFKTLGDVGEFTRGNGLQKKDLTESGVGAIHYGQVYTHYGIWAAETKSCVSPELAKKLRKAKAGDLVIATTSENDEDVCKAVAWLGTDDIAVSGDAYIYHHSLEPKYVAYFFQSEQFQSQKIRHITGTKVKRISGESMAKFRIPVPPREVQREIVKVLDTFTKLEAELEAELEARRRQYQYYRDALLTFGERTDADASKQARITTLGEIGSFMRGTGIQKVGYPAIYGNAIIMQWNQRTPPLNAKLPRRGLITRATTPNFWRGFRMTLPASTILTGFDGRTGLSARRVTALRAGA